MDSRTTYFTSKNQTAYVNTLSSAKTVLGIIATSQFAVMDVARASLLDVVDKLESQIIIACRKNN